jgi:hypothetical protein
VVPVVNVKSAGVLPAAAAADTAVIENEPSSDAFGQVYRDDRHIFIITKTTIIKTTTPIIIF